MKNFAFISGLLCSSFLVIGQIPKAPLTVEQIWGTGTFYEKQPQTIVPLKNENYAYFTLENNEINKYEIKAHSSYKQATIVTATALGIDAIEDYILSPNEQQLMVVTNSQAIFRHSYTSDIFYYDIATKKGFEIAPQHKGKKDFSFAPNGKFIVYSYQNNLYKFDVSTQKTTALTTNGKHNEIINGTADWVYEEEFSQTKFYDISVDGRYVAYVSFEQFDVPPVVLSYYQNEVYPEYEQLKYPKVGEKNSVVKLHFIDLTKNTQKTIKLVDYEYIPRLNFSTKSDNYLVVQTLNRKQDDLKFYGVHLFGDLAEWSVINKENDKRYIEIEDNIYFEPNSDNFLTLSDRDGYKHIYRISPDGKTEQLTKGNFDVQTLNGFSSKGTILFTAAYNSPINSSICSIAPNGSKFNVLSEETNKHYGISAFTSGNTYFYGYSTDANTPKTIGFFDMNGNMFSVQEDNQKLKNTLESYQLSPKTFTKIKGVTDSLYASIIYPMNFDPNKKYPVYFHIYGGPGANTVNNRYGGPEFMYHELLAQRGYFVISVDPRGTLYRGADFKKQTYGKLGELELEDLIAVSKEISKWNFIDKDRIGIQGWSYGGFMASLAITKGADVFKTAIAVAPVTDWRFYDNVYTERYMNLLENNSLGYQTTSPMFYAKQMKGNFLLIHGDADDNVHVQNAMEFAKTLINLNKDFDYFVYPNKNHGIGGVRVHLFNKMLKFTLENL